MVGTYPPKACGLAAYAADLNAAFLGNGHETIIVASVSDDEVAPSGTIPLYRDHPDSYREVAHQLASLVDVVLIQHEFGIYGGDAGLMLHELTDNLTVPFAITLHTVAERYTARERAVLEQVLVRAAQIHVFTGGARTLLVNQHLALSDVVVVPHGVPVAIGTRVPPEECKAQFGIAAGAPLVSTFGLLSAGKGIESAILAIASLRSNHPSIRYVVAGRTHPEIARRDGEAYRRTLEALCRELGVEDNVSFIDKFLDVDELSTLLGASTVFVTPYHGAEQAISGALSFAIAAGLPFVSTPYRYAREMARAGAGLIAPWESGASGIAGAIDRLLTDTDLYAHCARAAQSISMRTQWPIIARQIATHLRAATEPARRGHARPAMTMQSTLGA